jgi:hypothetical protein
VSVVLEYPHGGGAVGLPDWATLFTRNSSPFELDRLRSEASEGEGLYGCDPVGSLWVAISRIPMKITLSTAALNNPYTRMDHGLWLKAFLCSVEGLVSRMAGFSKLTSHLYLLHLFGLGHFRWPPKRRND